MSRFPRSGTTDRPSSTCDRIASISSSYPWIFFTKSGRRVTNWSSYEKGVLDLPQNIFASVGNISCYRWILRTRYRTCNFYFASKVITIRKIILLYRIRCLQIVDLPKFSASRICFGSSDRVAGGSLRYICGERRLDVAMPAFIVPNRRLRLTYSLKINQEILTDMVRLSYNLERAFR